LSASSAIDEVMSAIFMHEPAQLQISDAFKLTACKMLILNVLPSSLSYFYSERVYTNFVTTYRCVVPCIVTSHKRHVTFADT